SELRQDARGPRRPATHRGRDNAVTGAYKHSPVSASQAQLEQALRDLPRIAMLVKDRGYRQVWRFEHHGRAYYLKFYPRPSGLFSREAWRRLFRGSPAFREFERL